MSLPTDTLLQLMALSDGELEGPDKERALALVAESEEARRAFEGMRSGSLGAWLGEAVAAHAAAADGVADAVMAKIAQEAEHAAPVVAEGGALAAGRASHGAAGVSGGSAVVPSRTRRAFRGPVVAGAVGVALAMAAGVTFYIQASGTRQAGEAALKAVESAGQPPDGWLSTVGAVMHAPLRGIEVDEVDSPARGVSVFEIALGPSAAGATSAAAGADAASPAGSARTRGPSSVVVMIDDEPGGR